MSDQTRVCEKCGYPGFSKDDKGAYQCRKCGVAWPHSEPPFFMVVDRTYFCGTGHTESRIREYRDSADGFMW